MRRKNGIATIISGNDAKVAFRIEFSFNSNESNLRIKKYMFQIFG
jgi:hypothetical protein